VDHFHGDLGGSQNGCTSPVVPRAALYWLERTDSSEFEHVPRERQEIKTKGKTDSSDSLSWTPAGSDEQTAGMDGKMIGVFSEETPREKNSSFRLEMQTGRTGGVGCWSIGARKVGKTERVRLPFYPPTAALFKFI